jgi:hypothetical protein
MTETAINNAMVGSVLASPELRFVALMPLRGSADVTSTLSFPAMS